VLVAAALAIFVATFDPNEYKPRLVELVRQQTGRTLAVDGRIELTVFPRIGAAVGKATLSEPNGPAAFARVEEARVAVALLPLLSRRVVVGGVTLKGLALDLVRRKDGRTNFDDLIGKGAPSTKPAEAPRPGPSGPPLAIDVGRITVENADIRWRDERDGTDVRLSGVALKTGRLASGVKGTLELAAQIDGAQPKAHLKVSVDTGYRIDFATSAVALSSLDLKVAGDAQGLAGIEARLKGEAVDLDPKTPRVTLSRVELLAKSKDGLDAKVLVPRLEFSPDRAQSQAITAQATVATPSRNVSAKIEMSPITATGKQIPLAQLGIDLTVKQADLAILGKLKTGVAIDLEREQAELSGLTGDLTITAKSLPSPSKGTVTGTARAAWGVGNASAQLGVKLDDSSIDATAAVAHWADPAITFSVVADRLNVDRYLPPSKPSAAGGGGAGGGTSPGAGGAPAETPFDLSALRALNATGTVKVGALQMSNVKAEQVAITIRAAGGKVDVNPISATLYQGTLAGTATVNAKDNGFAARQKLSGVSVGPLLRDAAKEDILEGRGTVTLDVTTTGTTVTALKKALAGTADVALKDGTIKGVDIPGIIRVATTLLGSKSALEQPSQSGAKTDFTDLTASFVIARGVAHNEDLLLKSSVLRLAGRGDIDVGEGRLDYTAKASVVAPASGPGAKELAQLAGVAVPVRVTGPLASPKYTVDVQGLATELAKSTLGRELERRLGGGKSGGQEGGGAGAIGDALKGLFGKPK
jgi:AsmA protein